MKRKLISLIYINILTIVSVCAGSVAGDTLVRITDLVHIKGVSNLNVSPNGKEVIFSVRGIVPDEKKKGEYLYDSQIWFKDLTSSAPARLFKTPEETSQVFYTPDGKRWVVSRKEGKKAQLFEYPNEGEQPRQATHVKFGVNSVKFSPDGKQLLFSRNLSIGELVANKDLNPGNQLPGWAFERPGDGGNEALRRIEAQPDADGDALAIAAYLFENEKDGKAKVTRKLRFQTETSTSGELRFTHWYLLDLEGGREPQPVTKGFSSYGSANFLSKDKVLLTVQQDSILHPDRVSSSDLILLDLTTGKQKQLFGDGEHQFQVEAVSNSGKYVAVSKGIQNSLTIEELYIYDAKTWKGVRIDLDRNKNNVQFTDDEKYIYFVSSSNGGRILNKADIKSGKVNSMTSVDEGIGDYWIGKNKALLTKTTYDNPSELYEGSADFKSLTAITDFNSKWLANRNVGKPEKHTFINEKGLTVEYWVLKPADYQEGKKFPVVVQIHGGPASMFGPGDGSMWLEYQYFRSKGYGVVFTNPRGSSGYGTEFLNANFKDWGPGPARDVLGSLDQVIAENWVDTTRLYITGGSYGGYLAAWILAHDQRFRAGSGQRGVYDLYVFFGSANVWHMLKRYYDGYPFEPAARDLIIAQSPTTHAANIKTPFLIFHGENDNRTGPTQSDFLYKQLKFLGRPVEYVRHPDASHDITRSGNVRQRIDQLLRTYEFFERFK